MENCQNSRYLIVSNLVATLEAYASEIDAIVERDDETLVESNVNCIRWAITSDTGIKQINTCLDYYLNVEISLYHFPKSYDDLLELECTLHDRLLIACCRGIGGGIADGSGANVYEIQDKKCINVFLSLAIPVRLTEIFED